MKPEVIVRLKLLAEIEEVIEGQLPAGEERGSENLMPGRARLDQVLGAHGKLEKLFKAQLDTDLSAHTRILTD